MPWKFDAQIGDLVFFIKPDDVSDPANVTLGDAGLSDLAIDTGDRTNDGAILDQGLRVIEVGG
jgi:hypothetical protein